MTVGAVTVAGGSQLELAWILNDRVTVLPAMSVPRGVFTYTVYVYAVPLMRLASVVEMVSVLAELSTVTAAATPATEGFLAS